MRLAFAAAMLAAACSNAPNPPSVEGAERREPAPSVTPKSNSPEADSPIARSWLRWTEDVAMKRRDIVKVDSKNIARVAETSIAGATTLLRDSPWKLLSRKEAEKLTGEPLAGAESGVVVLLRCVDMAHGDSGDESRRQVDWIEVSETSGRTVVVTSGWRFEDYAIRPCPIVAVLPSEPKDVYVELHYSHPSRALFDATSQSR